ncbi:dTDP-4-dehydrorhamnose 3,5-epimerase family protein [Candidatus Uhrbacteria bacterium]|nr:dTDP-4-dehydrorhamnose 3,5-epimerase family protein [Candidatus Uhrbacteria bacterium]
MIQGIQIKKITTHADDRGFFREVVRTDESLLAAIKQVSVTVTYPGVIKAFHWHKRQDDFWYVIEGMVRVGLYDQRTDSPTHGEKNVFVIGEDNPIGILIPRGVVHGYQVLGVKPICLVYCTTECYDPKNPDEERMSWDDPAINFDWSIKNR